MARKYPGVEKYGAGWRYTISQGAGDSRVRLNKGGFKTALAAHQARIEVLKEMQQGTYVESNDITVGDYIEQWLQGKMASVRSGTYRAYVSNSKRIVSHLGNIPLQKLTPQQVQAFYTAL